MEEFSINESIMNKSSNLMNQQFNPLNQGQNKLIYRLKCRWFINSAFWFNKFSRLF